MFRDQTELDRYIDCAKKSTTAPRLVLLFIHLAVAVAFFAFWNARQGSWTNLRIKKIKNALLWLDRPKPGANAPTSAHIEYHDALIIYKQFHLELPDRKTSTTESVPSMSPSRCRCERC